MVGHPSLESAFLKEAWHPRVPPPEVPPSGLEASSSLPPPLQWSGSGKRLLTCFLEGLEHGTETPEGHQLRRDSEVPCMGPDLGYGPP